MGLRFATEQMTKYFELKRTTLDFLTSEEITKNQAVISTMQALIKDTFGCVTKTGRSREWFSTECGKGRRPYRWFATNLQRHR